MEVISLDRTIIHISHKRASTSFKITISISRKDAVANTVKVDQNIGFSGLLIYKWASKAVTLL